MQKKKGREKGKRTSIKKTFSGGGSSGAKQSGSSAPCTKVKRNTIAVDLDDSSDLAPGQKPSRLKSVPMIVIDSEDVGSDDEMMSPRQTVPAHATQEISSPNTAARTTPSMTLGWAVEMRSRRRM